MPVMLIISEHGSDCIRRKEHIKMKVNRNVPWTIVFRLCAWMKFQLQIFNVINPGEDHGLKGFVLSFHLIQIFLSEKPQKREEDLIIRTFVYLINHQNDILGAVRA